tara:strand:+ start:12350 stop:13024 length:675 start_codon:yes stop_codon:yes gene_type:complete
MSKVLRHPDKEDIIARLISGDSVKEVDSWLKSKYPRKKRLHISYMTLQKFRSDHLNLKGEVLEDIKNKRSEVDKASAAAEAKMIIESSSAYHDKINEIASNEMDVTRRLLEIEALVNSRIKYYYDLLNNGGSLREDKIFLEYISALKGIMQDWKKYIEGVADQKIEHNVSVSVINDHAEILKSAVLDVLNEMSPELVGVFIERVSVRMRELTLNDAKQIEVIDV